MTMTQTRTMTLPTGDTSALTGCPWHDVKSMLRQVGLRPTRQRMALGWILFGKGDRHLTAERGRCFIRALLLRLIGVVGHRAQCSIIRRFCRNLG